jgi:rod shape-determining protein MreD
LAFLTIGFLVGFCQKIYFRESLILPAVLITVSDLLYGIYYYITEFLVRAKLNFGFYFLHIILPEAIYTAIVGILVFRLLVALEHTITSRREEVEF